MKDSRTRRPENVFAGLVAAWLWFTVLFANFAEAVAEGRGKAQADELRKTRATTVAHAAARRRASRTSPSVELRVGDEVVVSAGEVIPADGEVIEGIASVDESAITGESAPVIRESGGDRSAVTGGTRVLSDRIVVRVTAEPGESFLDRMIALVEGAERQKTPNEIALNILLAGLTIVFLLAVVTLQPFAVYSGRRAERDRARRAARLPDPDDDRRPALGDRHRRHGPAGSAQRARAVRARGRGGRRLLDAAARQDRHDHARQPAGDRVRPAAGRDRATSSPTPRSSPSLADETPEGRSIVVLAKEQLRAARARARATRQLVPFTAQTRMSGVDLDGRSIRKGAADSDPRLGRGARRRCPAASSTRSSNGIARAGGTPLVVARTATARSASST